ncbi:IclR family transcriptional regulator|uniref:Transcriptional regulator, IclR family n=1 Tax=Dendrosporobacter quercicolus TaxID=146817 RepID=A0A1G9Q2W1_9FIRM|nr:IclR family transcriptional regulator [Dendrosporobacter quercicolus]NSL48093.1 IclR family transcriptional regulator [Dendrosporobacter quercicolus DSM 1736]SDM05061.1 transcriptional regulator, IclR family [Dendrosporobacter quercicolus]
MAGNPSIVKSAARTLAILEFIVQCPKAPTFTVLQEHMDIPKSSLSYLLQELLSQDYIQFDADRRVYSPGLRLVQMSASCINNTNLSKEIWQGIKKLSEDLGETTHAAVLDGRFIVYIAKCQGTKDVSIVTTVGFRVPAHATAIGKMLLSSLNEAELEHRLGNTALERYTDNTLTAPDQLMAAIRQAAVEGYAIDQQEIISGGVCVAAPVYDQNNKMIVAISVTMPAVRATESFLEECIRQVKQVADTVSRRLGKL